MSDVKSLSQNLDANVQARDLLEFVEPTKNVYEALNVIARRSEHISVALKEELLSKLDEFAMYTEAIEEVQENKEQIELSKSYERMASPTIIAAHEYLSGQLHHHYKNKEEEEV